jgi:calcium-activated chloride channel regulator 4
MDLELPGERNDARDELEIIWMQDDIEMQIVIDRSYSMNGDPFANAQQAAKTLVDDAEEGHTALGVVSFSDTTNQDQSIVPIPDPPGTVKTDIKTVIDNLIVDNNTAMFDGAKLGLDNLVNYATTAGTNAAQLVFLLSDGLDNVSSETQATVTAAYQAADVPLSTFAYGGFAPEGVLRNLAEDTEGIFRASPTTLAEVQSAFLATKAALTSSAAVLQETGAVSAASTRNFDFAVDDTMQELSIYANYLGSLGDVVFSLSGQSGPVSILFNCTEVAGATACSAVVKQTDLITGGIGEWALRAKNNTGASIDVNADILAIPLPVRTFDLVVSSLGGSEVTYPNPILITATPSQGVPITGVGISATITDPMGTIQPLNLVDTGQNGDGIAGDGTYSAILDYDLNGIYLVNVMVNNAALTAQFTMEGEVPALSAATDGTSPPAYVLPPITQNFSRTASIQLTVSGVVADDHPDYPPGTGVAADNGDVPGRIEVPGDVDVFTVPTGGLDYLIFRVTGLALGMEPRLRVLDEDGSEIVAASSNDLVNDEAYLALAVPVNGSTVLHAEVSHANNGTGMYQFSAGKPIFSDALKVPVDIKPQSCPNPVNTSSNGVLPVAILGTEDFDVTQIDPATVRLSDVSPLRWSLEDNSTPFAPFVGKENCDDCNELGPDGYLDLTLKFNFREVVEGLGDVSDRDCIVVTLTAGLKEEFGGTPIVGEDVVVILKKK